VNLLKFSSNRIFHPKKFSSKIIEFDFLSILLRKFANWAQRTQKDEKFFLIKLLLSLSLIKEIETRI